MSSGDYSIHRLATVATLTIVATAAKRWTFAIRRIHRLATVATWLAGYMACYLLGLKTSLVPNRKMVFD
jgi:hypothetical protein